MGDELLVLLFKELHEIDQKIITDHIKRNLPAEKYAELEQIASEIVRLKQSMRKRLSEMRKNGR